MDAEKMLTFELGTIKPSFIEPILFIFHVIYTSNKYHGEKSHELWDRKLLTLLE